MLRMMKSLTNKSMTGSILLLIGTIIYYFLAIFAILNYSGGFDIFNDLWTHLRWYGYNPDGALFFRTGNLVYAITLLFFFLSFSVGLSIQAERKISTYLTQIFGIGIAVSMIIGEILADLPQIFIVASGIGLLFTILMLVGIAVSFYNHEEFWKASILLFILCISLNSYLLFIGIIDIPIQEFRIIDFLVTVLNHSSICVIALNKYGLHIRSS